MIQSQINRNIRLDLADAILLSKAKKDLSFAEIADGTGLAEAFVTAALLGQQALPADAARLVGAKLDLAHDFAPCAPGAENALPVELLSASENPFDWNLIFQLPDGTTRLWWKVSKTTLSVAEPDAPACLSAPPECIMALVDHK